MTEPSAGFELSTLVRGLPDAVIVVDQAANIVWGNDAAERLFGRTADDSVGLSGLDFIHPDDLEVATLSLASVQGKQVGTPLELRIRGADGWHLVEMVGAPVGHHVALVLRDLTERRRWELSGDHVDRLRAILQHAAPATMLLDSNGLVQSTSAAIARVFSLDQEWIEGRPITDLTEGADREAIESALAAMVEEHPFTSGDMRVEIDVELHRPGGVPVPVSLTLANLLDDPTVQGVVATLHDISRRVRAEDDLRRSNSLLAATLDATAEGVLVVDHDGVVSSFNQRFLEMWHIPPHLADAGADGPMLEFAIHTLSDPEAFRLSVADVYEDPEADSHDLVEFLDGRVFERDSRPHRVDGRTIGRVWSFRDVTAQRVLQDELAKQASHDPLTGLANQTLFRERVGLAAAAMTQPEDRLAVLFIDLDDFKTVNDSLGHSAGDQMLVSVSRRLRHCVRGQDTVARLGGDEFAVLVERCHHEGEAVAIARRIMTVLSDPIRVAGRRKSTSASIGIVFGGAGETADDLLRNADLAMYVAKNSGRNRHCLYSPEMHDAALHRLEVDSRLRGAAARGELIVHYQPVVDAGSGDIRAFEALVRWQHPDQGLLMPADFIPLAEQSDLIDEIGQYVLGAACDQARAWADLLGADDAPAVTVNLAPRQLLDELLADRVARHLERSGIAPSQLMLEVTESALMQDPAVAARQLESLRRIGIRLALDDFGTGHSSLSHLQEFPIDTLKIDRTFTAAVEQLTGSSLIRTVVELAHILDMKVVAEGVETEWQRQALVALDCDLAQGYLFARPVDSETATELALGHTIGVPI